jgi:hypothetical protein
MFSWFAFMQQAPALGTTALDSLAAQVARVPGLHGGLVFSPLAGIADHPFSGDEPAPALALQLHFATIEALENAAAEGGALGRLLDAVPGGSVPTHQAMLRRRYPVPDATLQTAPGQLPCTFLVKYPGPASDLNAWNGHYNRHHPPIMARFPGIRAVEIYTRIDWVTGLAWPREDYMQRNKVMFDSPAALSHALASPVLADMRADFNSFPPFTGGNVHYAMETRAVGNQG